MNKLGVAVVGYGYWGPNLVRNFRSNAAYDVRYIVERQEAPRSKAAFSYPEVKIVPELQTVLDDASVNAVAIATPTESHFSLALAALKRGKHVLIEKPMTMTVNDAQILVDTARQFGLTLMVDHTFIYTPAVGLIKDRIDSNDLGEIYYYDSTRINLGLFQTDVNVLWDLAVHDISILLHLFMQRPLRVSAHGVAHVEGHPENTAYMSLFYPGHFIAHVNVSWVSPIKTRQTLIGGQKKMIVYNDLEPTEKVKIYDNGISLHVDPETSEKLRIGYRLGDILIPQIATTEALGEVVAHFAKSILDDTRPITDGRMGLEVVKVLEAASLSMKKGGQQIEILQLN